MRSAAVHLSVPEHRPIGWQAPTNGRTLFPYSYRSASVRVVGVTSLQARHEVRPVADIIGPAPDRGPRCGVEHEFTVLRGTVQVDFRDLIHTVPIPGRRLDPQDQHAYRCSWGGALTADGREAEIATPPVRLAPGFAPEVVRLAEVGRRCLSDVLPESVVITGYSTHLNFSVSDRGSLRAARRFATRFAPAMMLLLDRPDSPGLLVRPRPGRLELGGEFQAGEPLRAALVMAAGAVAACSARTPLRRMPPALEVDLAPALQRFGWYVDRRAFGADLYALGRDCPVRTLRGGRRASVRTAQRQLEDCWSVARRAVSPWATRDDLRLVDDLVAGRAPLPLESSGAVAR